jgi:integrase
MSDKLPSYRLHKQSGQAIVTLTDGLGRRRDVLLGKYGTKESRLEYTRVIAEWEANGRRPVSKADDSAAADLTVNELAVAFWQHVEQHYRHLDGTPTSEQSDYKLSLRPLKHLYGHTTARDFGPLALKAVRQLMMDGYEHPKHGLQSKLARSVVNQRVGRIRRLFAWAVENEMVPSGVLHGLEAVRGLQRGRCTARETEPIKPVAEHIVNLTLPFLRPQVAAMVRLQLLTGMRPGEVVILRAIDIDMTGSLWVYRPRHHKTAHRGQQRVVLIGPRAQEVVRQYLKPDVEAFLFSPAEAVEAQHAQRGKERKTKVPPSQARRTRKAKPKRKPKNHYTVASYGRAIARACEKADQAAHQKDQTIPEDRVIVPHWHPHQLRHAKATEIRKEFGLDAARAVLGHRSPVITEVYAELDLDKAAEVMGRLG